MFEIDYHPYTIDDVNVLLDSSLPIITTNKKIKYYNVACTIDIESSSFYEDENKRAIMYSFVIGIDGRGVIARTYDELKTIIDKIVEFYGLKKDTRMIFYIHNLQPHTLTSG